MLKTLPTYSNVDGMSTHDSKFRSTVTLNDPKAPPYTYPPLIGYGSHKRKIGAQKEAAHNLLIKLESLKILDDLPDVFLHKSFHKNLDPQKPRSERSYSKPPQNIEVKPHVSLGQDPLNPNAKPIARANSSPNDDVKPNGSSSTNETSASIALPEDARETQGLKRSHEEPPFPVHRLVLARSMTAMTESPATPSPNERSLETPPKRIKTEDSAAAL